MGLRAESRVSPVLSRAPERGCGSARPVSRSSYAHGFLRFLPKPPCAGPFPCWIGPTPAVAALLARVRSDAQPIDCLTLLVRQAGLAKLVKQLFDLINLKTCAVCLSQRTISARLCSISATGAPSCKIDAHISRGQPQFQAAEK
jgi:hypothetical protein